jgi:hypothetical protein
MKRLALLSVWLAIPLTMAGCTNWERQSFQTLSASKVVIDQAEADYTAKTLPQTQAVYAVLKTANAAQTAAVNQMEAYEELKATGAGTSQLTVAESQVTAALAQLPAIIVEVKGLYTTGGK